MRIGYARVSKHEQHLELQLDALEKAGCGNIFTDKVTGMKAERKGLLEAVAYLRKGDTLVVWRLDRLGRSLKHLIETLTSLHEKAIEFKSLTENIDTSTSTGMFMFHMIGALADFERNLIRERTLAGLEAARARGHTGGRPKVGETQIKIMARKLYADKSNKIKDICKTLRISRATLYRYVKNETILQGEELLMGRSVNGAKS